MSRYLTIERAKDFLFSRWKLGEDGMAFSTTSILRAEEVQEAQDPIEIVREEQVEGEGPVLINDEEVLREGDNLEEANPGGQGEAERQGFGEGREEVAEDAPMKEKKKRKRARSKLKRPQEATNDPTEAVMKRQRRTYEEIGQKSWVCSEPECQHQFAVQTSLKQHCATTGHKISEDPSLNMMPEYRIQHEGICSKDCTCRKAQKDRGEKKKPASTITKLKDALHPTMSDQKWQKLGNSKIKAGNGKGLPSDPEARAKR